MQKIKWGIIGVGNIAQSFAADIKYTKNSELYAIASRSGKNLELFKKYSYKVAYNDYDQLLADPDVDIVYVATPHSAHYENVMAALDHNKHVLCEKPFAVNKKQTEEMLNKAEEKKCFIMEAMWTKFFPAFQKVVDSINSGVIGDICQINADFCNYLGYDPNSRLFNPELAGGSLLDVGIYPITFAYTFSGIPVDIAAFTEMTQDHIDSKTAIILKHKSNSISNLASSISHKTKPIAWIYGTKGCIKINETWWRPESFVLEEYHKKIKEINCRYYGNGYQFEIDHCAECISEGLIESPLHTHNNTLDIVRILDDIRKLIDLKYPLLYE